MSAEVEKMVVFQLTGDNSADIVQQPKWNNVLVIKACEMSQFIIAESIDVWHDFGIYTPSILTKVRASSRKAFCVSFDVPPKMLFGAGSSEAMTLGVSDVAIYSFEAFLKLAAKAVSII
jgi:hypothetical protein